MRKLTLLSTFLMFFTLGLLAQTVPQGMKYQAVARNVDGTIIANQPISLKISLIDESGREIYFSETHYVKTNQLGLFDLTVGDGNVLEGGLSTVPWDRQDIWMQMALDQRGGNDFVTIYTSRLLTVPYAFHAGTASELVFPSDGDRAGCSGTGGVPANVWSLKGNCESNPAVDKLGTVDCADLVIITDNQERLRISCAGDIDIKSSLSVGKDLVVKQNVYLNTTGGSTTVNGPLTVANMSATNLTGTLNVAKATTLNTTLGVTGATTLGSTLGVSGATTLSSTLGVTGATSLSSTLGVTGATSLSSTLGVTGATTLSSTLGVTGATTLSSTLGVTGVTTLNNTLNVNGGGSYIANFVNSTNANGISIKVANATPNNVNNFITFKNSSGGTVGRIEGQNYNDWTTSFDFIFQTTFFALDEALTLAEAAAAAFSIPPDVAEAAVGGLQGATLIAHYATWEDEKEDKLGIVYESGSGDYAEWLEKKSPAEVFSYGDIVGVKGGKISKSMANPDNYMVVSKSPIVLGNMPMAGKEDLSEKVAFMGQVPVKVRGKVEIGDYIIPSDLNDGFGKGVNPAKMTLDQYKKIVGVAWSASKIEIGGTMVNVAVGINTNDAVAQIIRQQQEIEALKSSMNSIASYLKAKDPAFDAAMFNVSAQPAQEPLALAPSEATGTFSVTSPNRISSLMKDNPDLLKQVMADAKANLDKRGVDYNRYEQTKRLLNDENYLVEVLEEMGR